MRRTRRTGLITKSDRAAAIAVIGGGATGTILAAQLARRGIRSLLIDGSGRVGKGVAYSTNEAVHLLNVRAEGMSAWAGKPSHFADWFAAEGGEPKGFAQRRFFARYLGEVLDEAVASGNTALREATAVAAVRTGAGWQVRFDDNTVVHCDALVLASGNQDPEVLGAFSAAGERFIGNPWGDAARAAVQDLAATGRSALLVGTGLTMVDLVLSLDAAGHSGRILALSRRGLAPRSHADAVPAPVDADELPAGLQPLFQWLRRRSAKVGWRAAVDSLRPHSHSLWQSLANEERQRFLRHARPWWDVHRHRIAPQVAATAARLVGEGRLEIIAGRILCAKALENGIAVEYRRRGADAAVSEEVAYAFNCTGPLQSTSRTKDPLLRSLLDTGEVKVDQLDLGLDVDANCRAGEHLWAMGTLTKGRFWEIIAVPDIREQAAVVADAIERELGA